MNTNGPTEAPVLPAVPDAVAMRNWAEELVDRARAEGVEARSR